jgi:hypothetical protein
VSSRPILGGLYLRRTAFQLLTLPRQWNDDRPFDDDPLEQLEEIFQRVRSALHAWIELLDILKGSPR